VPAATLPDDLPGGTYFLRARISSGAGDVLSTNAYEVVVPDTEFGWLDALAPAELAALIDGTPNQEGFHYWRGGAVVHRASPGLRGLLAGWAQAESMGIDLHETAQGEHLFRHLVPALAGLAGAPAVIDALWTIRSEVISPVVKTRTLLRYIELLVRRAERVLPRRRRRVASRPSPQPASPPPSSLFPPVGRDVLPTRPAGSRRRRPKTSPITRRSP